MTERGTLPGEAPARNGKRRLHSVTLLKHGIPTAPWKAGQGLECCWCCHSGSAVLTTFPSPPSLLSASSLSSMDHSLWSDSWPRLFLPPSASPSFTPSVRPFARPPKMLPAWLGLAWPGPPAPPASQPASLPPFLAGLAGLVPPPAAGSVHHRASPSPSRPTAAAVRWGLCRFRGCFSSPTPAPPCPVSAHD